MAIAAPYLLALASPLRLFDDAVVYLSLADGTRLSGHHQIYPPGYPALLRLADHAGLGSAWGFVAVNLLLLAVAVGSVYRLCRQPMGLSATKAALVCLGVLLAHVVSDTTPVLRSDTAYFGVAMLCLLVVATAERRSGRSRAGLVILGGALAGAAISIRIAGLALVPPAVFVAVGKGQLIELWRLVRRRRATMMATAAGSLLVLGAVTVLSIRASPYAGHIADTWRSDGGIGAFLGRLAVDARAKLSSMGELALQIDCCTRVSRALALHDLGIAASAFAVAGLGLLALMVLGWRTRRRIGAIEIFVLSTAGVILVYPGGTSRFWIAALPFMIVYALWGLERLARFKSARVAIVLYVTAFAVTGGAWLINSAQISMSGRNFPRVAAARLGPQLAASYRVALGESRPGDNARALPAAVDLLRRYEPLARHR